MKNSASESFVDRPEIAFLTSGLGDARLQFQALDKIRSEMM